VNPLFRFPVFNLADVFIVIGATMVVVQILRSSEVNNEEI